MSPMSDLQYEQKSSRRSVPRTLSMDSDTSTKSVGFDKVEMIEFLPALGDNPSVSAGVPVTLSDEVTRTRKVRLEKYERVRKPRRDHSELILQRDAREEMLLTLGYEKQDITETIRSCRKARHAREHSYYTQHWDGFHEKLEGTQKSLLRILGLRKSSKDLFHQTVRAEHLSQKGRNETPRASPPRVVAQ